MEVLNKHPLFTIVIPFYKGEKYIACAIESVLSQPYKHVEVLLINDGSPTGTGICEHIAKTDSRIKYFYKQNEGIGSTRNFGIEHASGDWLAFLDQDDIWVKNFLTDDVVQKIINAGDVVGFSYYACNNSLSRGTLVKVEEKTISGGGNAAQTCHNHHSSMVYKRALFVDSDIRYALTRHEDVIFLQKVLYVAKKVTYIDKVMFLYRNNYSSETHRMQRVETLYGPILNSWKELLNWHLVNHPDDIETIRTVKYMICVYAIEAVEMLYKTGISEETAEGIVDKHFCREFLDLYKDIVLEKARFDQIGFYYNHRKKFIIRQRALGKIDNYKNRLKNYVIFRTLNNKIKYRSVLPKGLYTN